MDCILFNFLIIYFVSGFEKRFQNTARPYNPSFSDAGTTSSYIEYTAYSSNEKKLFGISRYLFFNMILLKITNIEYQITT